ncbi:alpha/beta hydrolase [Gloeocapsa sp. BRSZ]
MRLRFLHLAAALVASSVFLSSNGLFEIPVANAAERVVLRYRIFRQSLSVAELAQFAETGELSRSLRSNLARAGQDPATVRRYLTEPVKVNPVFLDRLLNSPVGNALLDEISQVIYTPSRRADRQALRAALVLSARDGQVSLIEVLQNYPTREVQVDGDRLEIAYRQLRRLSGNIQDILNRGARVRDLLNRVS